MPLFDTLATASPIIGTLAGGPVGGAIGTMASGLFQGAGANDVRKAYDKYADTIPTQDPEQVAFRETLRRRRSALEAGTDAFTSNRIRNANNALAQTQANITRSGHGTTSELLRSQRAADQVIGNAGADANRNALSLLGAEGALTNSMAARLYGQQQDKAANLWQEYARKREDANRTTMAGIGLLPQLSFSGIMGGGKRGFSPDLGTGMGDTRFGPNETYSMTPRQTQLPSASTLSYQPNY